MPTAIAVLRKRLGTRKLMLALFHYLRRGLGRDPLRHIPVSSWPRKQDRLTRRQFRSALLFEDVLTTDLVLPRAAVDDCLHQVIATVGARFIEANIPTPSPERWRTSTQRQRLSYLTGVIGRFFNARTDNINATEERFGFDVTGCRFVELARAVGRPELVRHFCAADSQFFTAESSPVEFRRTETLAEGAQRCDFRFVLRSEEDDHSETT